MTDRVIVGEEDGDRWFRIDRFPESGAEVVQLTYLEGARHVATIELDASLAAQLGIALAGLTPVRDEHRAVYPIRCQTL